MPLREFPLRQCSRAWSSASLLSAAVFISILQPAASSAQEPPVFLAADYGAVPDDGLDDRAAIQAALNAASAAGGTALIGPGVYDIAVVLSFGLNAAGGTSGTSGYHGLIVPADTTMAGTGRDVTVLRFNAGGGNPVSVGNCIVNANYNLAQTDYGAGSGYVLRDFMAEVTDITQGPTGNLVGFAHASGAFLKNLQLGGSKYHALEFNRSRNITVEDVRCDGLHPASSTLQLDIGTMGSKSLRPSTTVLQNMIFRRCEFTGRAAETTSTGKVVELGHTGSACILRNIAFEDCLFESLSRAESGCVTTDNPPAQEVSGLRFERCRFVGLMEQPGINGLLQLPLQGTQLLQDVTVRDCLFEGAYSQGLVIVTTSYTFNSGHQYRRNILIEGNRFAPVLNRSTPVSGGSFRLLSAAACESITIRRNLLEVPQTDRGGQRNDLRPQQPGHGPTGLREAHGDAGLFISPRTGGDGIRRARHG
jgi:hypothetical protein